MKRGLPNNYMFSNLHLQRDLCLIAIFVLQSGVLMYNHGKYSKHREGELANPEFYGDLSIGEADYAWTNRVSIQKRKAVLNRY